MKTTNTKSLVEGALLSAITIILSLISLYIPVLGVFASLIWPVPIVILGIRHGLKTSILATVVSGILVAMLEGPTQAFVVILGFGLIGNVMGWAIKKNYPPTKVILFSSIASIVSKIALILISLYILGIDIIGEEIFAMRESIGLITNMYKGMGIDPNTLKTITESFTKMLDLIAIIIPGILVLSSLMDAFLNFKVSKLVISRLGQKIPDLIPFWLWRLPTYTVFLFLIGVLLNILETYWPVGILKTIGMNIQTVFFFCFFIEGFSLMAYFMGKYNVAKVLRVIVILLAFFNPLISQLVVWAGMFDILFNFRKI